MLYPELLLADGETLDVETLDCRKAWKIRRCFSSESEKVTNYWPNMCMGCFSKYVVHQISKLGTVLATAFGCPNHFLDRVLESLDLFLLRDDICLQIVAFLT